MKASLEGCERDTQARMAGVEAAVATRRPDVVAMLLGGVRECRPRLHPNAQLRLGQGRRERE